jgi:predicted MFS family arabinose efflux permease
MSVCRIGDEIAGVPVSRGINRWWTVLAGALACGVGAGIAVLYGFPILAASLERELGWDRSFYSFCLTCFLAATGVGTITLGVFIRRLGVRRAASLYILVFAGASACIAVLPHHPAFFYSTFFCVGLGGAAASALPYAVAVTGLFERQRGLALGLVNAGAGVGSACMPLLAHFLDGRVGWRTGFVTIALLLGVVPLLGLCFLVREPPDAVADARMDGPRGFSFLSTRSFWLIAVPVAGLSISTFGVMGILVPFFSDRGLTVSTTAVALSVAGTASWIGRLVTGALLDRIFAPHLAAAAFVVAILGIVLLLGMNASVGVIAGAALVGVTLGAEGDLVAYLVSRYFSLQVYSRALGFAWVAWAWGGGIGSYVAGSFYRATHSYRPALILFCFTLALSALVVCFLGPYKESRGYDLVNA